MKIKKIFNYKLFIILGFLFLFTSSTFAEGFTDNWYNQPVYVNKDTLGNTVEYNMYSSNSDSLNSVEIDDTLYVKTRATTFVDGELRGPNPPALIKSASDLYDGVTFEDNTHNRYSTYYSPKKERYLDYYKKTGIGHSYFPNAKYNYRYADQKAWKTQHYNYIR